MKMLPIWKKGIFYIFMIFGAIVMLMPFAWMIMTSFKLDTEVESWPPRWTSKNFSNQRDVKLNLVRSADLAIDFSALTIEEFFNLSSIISSRKNNEKVLTYAINDDAPYRGVLQLQLSSETGKEPLYVRSIPQQDFQNFMTRINDLQPVAADFNEVLTKLAVIEDALIFLPSLMNELFFLKTGFLNRSQFTQSTTEKLDQLSAYLQNNGSRLIEHRSLLPLETDSEQVKALKQSYKNWVAQIVQTYDTKKGVYSLANLSFKKGQPILQQQDLVKIRSEFLTVFAAWLNQDSFSSEQLSLLKTQDWAVIRLVERNVLDLLRSTVNLLQTGIETYAYFSGLQTETLSSGKIVLAFSQEADLKNSILEQVRNSALDARQISILEEVIQKNPLSGSINKLLQEQDRIFAEELLKNGVDQSKVQNILLNLKDFVNSLNTSFLENPEAKAFVLRALGNGESVLDTLQAINIPATQKRILADQTTRLRTLLNEVSDSQFSLLLHERFTENEIVEFYSDLYSRHAFQMKILEGPKEVKEVRLRSFQSIEIVLDGIEPYWFWDEKASMNVRFTTGEVFSNLFQSYVDAWRLGKFFTYYYLNTIFVASVTTLLDILFACMAAFAFAKLKFFGKNFLFTLFLATMMVPGEVMLVPNYITLARFGWMDTYLALIVPWTVSVFVIFLIRQHFMSIPDELYDAGKIDGISKWGFLWQIMVPLSKPVIITGSLLKFIGSWNSFLWVLIVTKSPQVRTLPVGLSTFSTEVGTLYNKLMAASTFSMIPVIILFLFVQKYFIQGIARTGIK